MIRFYKDSRGFACSEVPAGQEELGNYFTSTAPRDMDGCNRLLEKLVAIGDRRCDKWEMTGNAHTIAMDHSGVSIENVWDDQAKVVHLDHGQFRDAMGRWIAFLRDMPA